MLILYASLVSDQQKGFRKRISTGDIVAFLTDSWSYSRSRLCVTFAVALNISNAFDRVWHKSFLSILACYDFFFYTFIPSLFLGRSISAGVVLFLRALFYHSLFFCCSLRIFLRQPILSPLITNDSTLHYFNFFDNRIARLKNGSCRTLNLWV